MKHRRTTGAVMKQFRCSDAALAGGYPCFDAALVGGSRCRIAALATTPQCCDIEAERGVGGWLGDVRGETCVLTSPRAETKRDRTVQSG